VEAESLYADGVQRFVANGYREREAASTRDELASWHDHWGDTARARRVRAEKN
jgi:hypothetical protein